MRDIRKYWIDFAVCSRLTIFVKRRNQVSRNSLYTFTLIVLLKINILGLCKLHQSWNSSGINFFLLALIILLCWKICSILSYFISILHSVITCFTVILYDSFGLVLAFYNKSSAVKYFKKNLNWMLWSFSFVIIENKVKVTGSILGSMDNFKSLILFWRIKIF